MRWKRTLQVRRSISVALGSSFQSRLAAEDSGRDKNSRKSDIESSRRFIVLELSVGHKRCTLWSAREVERLTIRSLFGKGDCLYFFVVLIESGTTMLFFGFDAFWSVRCIVTENVRVAADRYCSQSMNSDVCANVILH